MTTAIMEQTTRRLSETYGNSHRTLVELNPEERQRTWEDSIGALSNFDLNVWEDQIQAKAHLDALDQVLFAASRTVGNGSSGSV